MKIELIPLTAADPEIHELARIHQSPSVAEYLSLSDHYFDYVTGTEGVVYYKIIADGVLAGGIHCESNGEILFLSICVREESRRLGIAETALRKLFSSLSGEAGWIEVSIEKTNTPSLALFFKLGFQKTGEAEELLTLRLASKGTRFAITNLIM